MSVPSFAATDQVSAVLGFALDGLSLRQRQIADNLANVDTPDYRARAVDFEGALRAAIAQGRPERLSGTAMAVTDTGAPVGANGNNVDLRTESLSAMQTQFQYQMVARSVSDRFDLVRTVVGAQ